MNGLVGVCRIWLSRIGTVLIGASQTVIEFNPKGSKTASVSSSLGKLQEFIQESSGEILFCSLGLIAFGSLVRLFTNDPKITESIDSVLLASRRELFNTAVLINNPELHAHRITLFKYSRFCFRSLKAYGKKIGGRRVYPWSGWLIPVARSGHTTKGVRTIFHVDVDEAFGEGFAGKAFLRANQLDAENSMHLTNRLPSLIADRPQSVDAYASAVNQSAGDVLERHNRGRPQFRSLGAKPICVNDRPWGVFVLDSVSENAIIEPKQELGVKLYRQFEALLDTFIVRW